MSLREKIAHFKKQTIKIKLLSAIFLVATIALGLFLLFSLLEYTFWFSTSVRTFLFFSAVLILLVAAVWLVLPQLFSLFGFKKIVDDERAAKDISAKLPEINDDLINYLQLERNAESELAKASIQQKSSGLEQFDFLKAIDFKNYKKLSKVFTGIMALIMLIALFYRPLLTSGTQRLIRYNEEFVKPAPFEFVILNDLPLQ